MSVLITTGVDHEQPVAAIVEHDGALVAQATEALLGSPATLGAKSCTLCRDANGSLTVRYPAAGH
jgi:hypothetical protein